LDFKVLTDPDRYKFYVRTRKLIEDAKDAGTELWFADFHIPKHSAFDYILALPSVVLLPKGEIRLREPVRRFFSWMSRKIRWVPKIELRNAVWAKKIVPQAEEMAQARQSNVRIGLITGADHSSLPEHLRDPALPDRTINKFRYSRGLKLSAASIWNANHVLRAVFDKESGRWRVIAIPKKVWA
jgi:hypothetical protein